MLLLTWGRKDGRVWTSNEGVGCAVWRGKSTYWAGEIALACLKKRDSCIE